MMIHDHHQGYIDWDRFTANGARLQRQPNPTLDTVIPGPAREGLCVSCRVCLVCGVCATPEVESVRYKGNDGVYPMYERAPPECVTG